MSEIHDRGDQQIADYLERVQAAASGLDPGRRQELIDDLREHIATARAELSPETEAGVRTLLDRLGDPAAIVAEAATGEPVAAPPPVKAAASRTTRVVLTVLIAVLAVFALAPIALCVGGLLYLIPATAETHPGPEPVEASHPASQSR
jgi:uncharacterized membrane protein